MGTGLITLFYPNFKLSNFLGSVHLGGFLFFVRKEKGRGPEERGPTKNISHANAVSIKEIFFAPGMEPAKCRARRASRQPRSGDWRRVVPFPALNEKRRFLQRLFLFYSPKIESGPPRPRRGRGARKPSAAARVCSRLLPRRSAEARMKCGLGPSQN